MIQPLANERRIRHTGRKAGKHKGNRLHRHAKQKQPDREQTEVQGKTYLAQHKYRPNIEKMEENI